jgi:hypothetical protein
MEYAKIISTSSLCPLVFRGKPADVLIAVQIGAELGVSPLQALANIAIINGRACLWGDLIVGLIQSSGRLEYLKESWDERTATATVRIKRKGHPERVETFSMADARRANLAGKDTYKQYPARMCGWRAKTYGIRAEFADVLKGLSVAEEVMDFAPSADIEVQQPIRTPQMLSEPAPDESVVDASEPFVPAPEGTPAPDPIEPKTDDDPPQDPPAAIDGLRVVGAIEARRGVNSKTKAEWVLYKITLSDGREAGTFSESLFALAQRALNEGLMVVAATSHDAKADRLNLNSLEIA